MRRAARRTTRTAFALLVLLASAAAPAGATTPAPKFDTNAVIQNAITSAAAHAAANRPAAPATPANPKAAETPGYTIDRNEPAWVDPAPGRVAPADESPVPRAPMHYALIDYQLRAEADTSVRFERTIRVVDETAGLDTASQFQLEFDPSYRRMVDRAFDKIRQAGRGMPAVAIRLLDSIAHIMERTVGPGQRNDLLRQADMIMRAAEEEITEAFDLEDVRRRNRNVHAVALLMEDSTSI